MPHHEEPDDHVSVADVEVSSVTPEKSAFLLEGRGADRANYRLRLELEVPLDQRTKSVLGEMLSQCRIRVWRRAVAPPAVKGRSAAGPAASRRAVQNEP